MRLNRKMNIQLLNSRSVVTQTLRLIAALTILGVATMNGLGQEKNPQRGFQPGNSYSISDIESISNTNGNLILNLQLGNLAPGRGGRTSGISLRYNSKIYDTDVAELVDSSGELSLQTHLIPSHNANWDFVNPLSYRVEFISRFNVEGLQSCPPSGSQAARCVYIWKVRVVYPDAAEREFRPVGANDILGDGYFNINPNTLANPLSYISTDGTYTRLVITRGTGWTLSFPDGSRAVSNGGGGNNTSASFFYDRNNNYLTNGNVTLPTGEVVSGLVDQFGRYVAKKRNTATREDYIYSLGFNNQSLKWTVKWKTIFILRDYRTAAVSGGIGRGNTSDQTYVSPLDVVESITLPSQLGSLSYQFSYNAPDWVPGTPEPTTPSVGWGEVSGITLPSGAQASYKYAQDSTIRPSVRSVLDNQVTRKTLTYQAEYDGSSTPVTETWGYAVTGLHTSSTTTGPDGGVTQFFFRDTTSGLPNAGQVYKEIQPNGEVLERNWQSNHPPTSIATTASGAALMNYYVKTEFRSIPDAAGTLVWTAIKDYNYDKNGNVTRVAEYDWVPYSSYVAAGGIPAGSTPTRVSIITYHNATPDATNSTSDSAAAYWYTNAASLRTAAASNEIQTGTGQRLTHADFTYDDPFSTGNLTKQTIWDSSKGAYSSPLLPTNSISVSTQYNQYGMPTLITDAQQVQRQLIYGAVGSVFDLYPTEVRTAAGTIVQRIEIRTFDFSSGLVTNVTDADNGVSTITSYDDIGRPILVRTAAGVTDVERQTSMQYFDLARRVVMRSDLNGTGDGKLVSIKHYDQLGRVRLARRLEDFSNQPLDDETLGIKVQTRYLINNPCQPSNSAQCLTDNNAIIGTYVLTSNPYRATTSVNANTESTMGWKRSRADRTGRMSETQTFSGSGLPAPWGANGASTGAVTTAYDSIFTTSTDQAGKVRRSKVDALGRPVRVDEPDVSNNLGSQTAPTQGTSYEYDALGNLTLSTQGSQTRIFSYTSLSRLREATNPESGTVNYEYYENGNLKTKLDPRLVPNTSTRVTISYVYDELNRLTSRSYNDGTPNVTYGYDATGVLNSRGRLTSVSSSVSSYSYGEYDAQGQVKTGTQTTAGQSFLISYQYNVAGALISQTYPSGRVVKTEYDGAGRTAGVKNDATGTYYVGAVPTDATNRIQYSAAGAMQAMKLGNGLWEHTNFNSRLQAIQIGLGSASTNSSFLQLDYDYGTTNNNGNLQSQTITVPIVAGVTGFTATQTYTYDPLNRLASAQENNGSSWKQNFDYDRYGNRKLIAGTTLPAALTPANNPVINTNNNRIDATVTGQTNIIYDNAGNLTREVAGHTYQYDAENKMLSYDGGATSSGGASYSYDGDGRRVTKVVGGSQLVTTVFVYDIKSQLVAEYSGSGSVNGGTSYITRDTLGSTRVITSPNQAIKGRYDYLPFGDELSAGIGGRTPDQKYGADNLRQKFTSKERDVETGLDYFGARYYASAQGRFTGADLPFADQHLNDPQSWNLYVYTRNNPLRYIDPTGRGIGSFLEKIKNGLAGYGLITDKEKQKKLDDARKYLKELEARSGGLYDRSNLTGNVSRIDVDKLQGHDLLDWQKNFKAAGADNFTFAEGQQPSGIVFVQPKPEGLLRFATSILMIDDVPAPEPAPLRRIHSDQTLDAGQSYEYWKGKSTEEIVESLRPGKPEALRTKQDGRIFNGNNRIRVLEERGFDVNSLPREIIE